MVKAKTQAQRNKWAAYMREYRARRRAGRPSTDRRGLVDAHGNLLPTARMVEILTAYADPRTGGSYRAVAERLGVKETTVHNSMTRLFERLHVRTATQAAYLVFVEGIDVEQALAASLVQRPTPTVVRRGEVLSTRVTWRQAGVQLLGYGPLEDAGGEPFASNAQLRHGPGHAGARP